MRGKNSSPKTRVGHTFIEASDAGRCLTAVHISDQGTKIK